MLQVTGAPWITQELTASLKKGQLQGALVSRSRSPDFPPSPPVLPCGPVLAVTGWLPHAGQGSPKERWDGQLKHPFFPDSPQAPSSTPPSRIGWNGPPVPGPQRVPGPHPHSGLGPSRLAPAAEGRHVLTSLLHPAPTELSAPSRGSQPSSIQPLPSRSSGPSGSRLSPRAHQQTRPSFLGLPSALILEHGLFPFLLAHSFLITSDL